MLERNEHRARSTWVYVTVGAGAGRQPCPLLVRHHHHHPQEMLYFHEEPHSRLLRVRLFFTA